MLAIPVLVVLAVYPGDGRTMAIAAIALLALYLLVGEPLLGRRSHRRMLATLDAGTRGVRLRFYLQWIWQAWALLAVTLIVTLGLARWTPAQLGLRLPYWPHMPAIGHGMLSGCALGAAIAAAAAAGIVLGIVMARKQRRSKTAPYRTDHGQPFIAGGDNVLRMLPRTRNERLGWTALSVTAGVTEEVIWRGFGLGLLFALLPSAHPAVPIVLAALVFGWAHFYQGRVGMLAAGLLGAGFAVLFWASGSLLFPILIHALIDLRALLIRVPQDSTLDIAGEQS